MKKQALHLIIIAFLLNTLGPLPMARAQEFILPKPGTLVHLSPSFNPPILKGIKVHTDNPFKFDFILDKGESNGSNESLKEESTKLIKYFLASITTPEKDLWVNLSPYEKDRIVPDRFGQTEMGRDLLAQDYMLKQITASLIYPEAEIGKKFWAHVYEESAKKFGVTSIPVHTFNKVWILPAKAVLYENAKTGTAYVVESKLKVMLEEDYLALEMNSKGKDSAGASQAVRDIVIPELEREVNEGSNFVQLRQVYHSLILATWYKEKIKDSILSKVYADKNKVSGVNIDDPREKQKIYERYLHAFKKGAYNYIKNEVDSITQKSISKKYFSGGVSMNNQAMHPALSITPVFPPPLVDSDLAMLIQVDVAVFKDKAMTDNRRGKFFHRAAEEYSKDRKPFFENAPIFKHVAEFLNWYEKNRSSLLANSRRAGKLRYLGPGYAVLVLYYAGKIQAKDVVRFQREVGAYEYATDSPIIMAAPTFKEVDPYLKWFTKNRLKLISKRSTAKKKEYLGAGYTALVLFYAGKIDAKKVHEVQRFAAAYDYARDSPIVKSAPKFNDIPNYLKWFNESRMLLRTKSSKADKPEYLRASYTVLVLFYAGKIDANKVHSFSIHGAAYERANNEKSVIVSEIQRIWSEVDRTLYRTDLARLKNRFDPKLLLNKKVKSSDKPLAKDYRYLILTYAYRLYGKELIESAKDGMKQGGIDFQADKVKIELQNSGSEIKFKPDPAMLEQFQNAPGFVPVIISIQPMNDLRLFLGLTDEKPSVKYNGPKNLDHQKQNQRYNFWLTKGVKDGSWQSVYG